MTTATEAPPHPPPGVTSRRAQRLIAKAHADAIRIAARTRAEADAELVRAQAAAADVTAAEMALVSEHNERLRKLERQEAEARAAAAKTEAGGDAPNKLAAALINIVSARDKGDGLWDWVIVIPLLAGSMAALFGQVVSLYPRLIGFVAGLGLVSGGHVTAVALAVALAVGITLETLGLVMARLAHKARLRKDSPAIYRAAMWVIVLYAAGVNYHEWSPAWTKPSVLGVLFASLSIASVLGWELREHRADRDRRAAEIASYGWAPTPIPPRPEFGMARWIVASRHTYTAWVAAVEERIPDADTALARANEILKERRDTSRTARHVKQAASYPERLAFGWRLRLLLTGRAPASVLAKADLSQFDVDVFGDDLPNVPSMRLDIPRQRAVATRQEAPAITAQKENSRQQEAAPSQDASVTELPSYREDSEVLAAIETYSREHGSLPTANWLKFNLRPLGSGRAQKLLDRYQRDASQEATG